MLSLRDSRNSVGNKNLRDISRCSELFFQLNED